MKKNKITVKIQIPMLMIIFTLHIHDTIFPRMWGVIGKFPSKSRFAVDKL